MHIFIRILQFERQVHFNGDCECDLQECPCDGETTQLGGKMFPSDFPSDKQNSHVSTHFSHLFVAEAAMVQKEHAIWNLDKQRRNQLKACFHVDILDQIVQWVFHECHSFLLLHRPIEHQRDPERIPVEKFAIFKSDSGCTVRQSQARQTGPPTRIPSFAHFVHAWFQNRRVSLPFRL